ncbi:MAG: hypothetical protein C5B54_11825 [Acidobacteria bacterium]|nr:MAG: hypothetical protein C5B54_11825 [Acidobacteriota bacterium]
MKKILVLIVLVSSYAFAQGQPPGGRLPGDVVPHNYQLSLTIDPTQDKFSGLVRIDLEFKKDLSGFWMHGQGLNVKESNLTLADGESVPVTYKQVNDDGVVWIGLPKLTSAQKASLSITYDAPFNRQLNGLYRVDNGGQSYAFTQFENVSARLCFPGFDEPGFKTAYDITVTAKKSDEVITNTLPDHEEDAGNGMKRIHFARTPNLPTYLLAFIVGPLDVVKGADIPPNEIRKNAVPVRGATVKGKGAQLAYALKTAGPILQVLEKYFGIAYPYDKLDLVAVPDFEPGAMENAATITFREWALLLDEKNAPDNQKTYFADTMAHEIAHQWFGDMVTMSWWDDVWLNESFATWIQTRAVKMWDPKSHDSTSAVQDSRGVMEMDSMVAARQIRQPVVNSSDIALAINWITYAKGAAVISMFERYIGPDVFQKGIHNYLTKYQNSNATTDDFLNSLSEAAHKDITSAFKTFLFQPGIPLLEVTPACSANGAQLRLKQSRYLPLGSTGNRNQTWQLPVCVRYEADGTVQQKCDMITAEEQTVELTNKSCPAWILPNSDAAGYYRWTLPTSEYSKLEKALDKLSEDEQLTFADSIGSGFHSGRLSATDVFNTLPVFAASRLEAVAKAPMSLIEFSKDYLVPRELTTNVETYSRTLYKPVYKRIGFDDQSAGGTVDEEARLLRTDVIPFLAFTGRDPEVREEARKRGLAFLGYGKDGQIHRNAVDVNLIGTCLGVAVQEGDSAFYETLSKTLKESNDPVLRLQIIQAMGRTTDPALVQKGLDLSLDPAILSNEVTRITGAMAEPVENREAVWQWMQQNMQKVMSRLPSEHQRYLPFLASRFCSEEKSKEVAAFFTPKLADFPAGKQVISGVMERINLCAAAVKAHQQSAQAFFEKQTPSTAALTR